MHKRCGVFLAQRRVDRGGLLRGELDEMIDISLLQPVIGNPADNARAYSVSLAEPSGGPDRIPRPERTRRASCRSGYAPAGGIDRRRWDRKQLVRVAAVIGVAYRLEVSRRLDRSGYGPGFAARRIPRRSRIGTQYGGWRSK